MMRPCGYCSKCKEGHVAECYFPMPETTITTTKGVSKVSANALASYYSNVGGKANTISYADSYKPCAHSHKPLVIKPADASMAPITIYGGKAGDPVKKDCDIYAKLDRYTTSPFSNYPWSEDKRLMFTFHIPDHNAPVDAEEFKRMIAWFVEQSRAGKVIHVGCVGGHGRTGMVLAALAKEIGGIEDAVTFVRENYCHKAVETRTQVQFLAKHFGIKDFGIKGSKEQTKSAKVVDNAPFEEWAGRKGSRVERHNAKYARASNDVAYPIKPVKVAGNIWGIDQDRVLAKDFEPDSDDDCWDAH